LTISHGNAQLLIGLNHLHLITHPLDDALMNNRWDTLVSMYPIPSKQHVVTSLHIHHEEGRRYGFAPNH
jgi:hypothetical protein